MNEDEMESASPEVYAFLEAEDYGYVIRLPANAVLQRRIAHLQGSRMNPVYPYDRSIGGSEVSLFAGLSRVRKPQSLGNWPPA